MPRGLSAPFLADLANGPLEPMLRRVKSDPTLCLELRENYLNIYYRGGNLLRLEASPRGYVPTFDEKYFKRSTQSMVGLPDVICTPADLASWLEDFPLLKNAIDLFPKHSVEREVQQLLVAANNHWGVARATDYYICDIEYANPFGRFDFVGVHWPSSPSKRKQQSGRRLVLGEVKYGDGALDGAAGLHAHVTDTNNFLDDPKRVAALKSEMIEVFNQKRGFGLVKCGKDIKEFSSERPLLLLVLANHDPDKSALCRLLGSLPPHPNVELRVASSCLMGYGLFDEGLLTVRQVLDRLGGTT